MLGLGQEAARAVMLHRLFQGGGAVLQGFHEGRDFVERVGVERVAHRLQIRAGDSQFALIADRGGEDHRLGHLDDELALDVDRLAVLLQVDVQSAERLALAEHLVLLEQGDDFGRAEHGQGIDGRLHVRQSAFLRLLMPGLGVIVAVEDDRAVLLDDFLEQRLDRAGQLRLGCRRWPSPIRSRDSRAIRRRSCSWRPAARRSIGRNRPRGTRSDCR